MQIQIDIGFSVKGQVVFKPSNTLSQRKYVDIKQQLNKVSLTSLLSKVKLFDYVGDEPIFDNELNFDYMSAMGEQDDGYVIAVEQLKPAHYFEEFPQFVHDDMVCITNLYYKLLWGRGYSSKAMSDFKNFLICAILGTFDMLPCKLSKDSSISHCTIRLLDKYVKNKSINDFGTYISDGSNSDDGVFASFSIAKGAFDKSYDTISDKEHSNFVVFDNYEIYAEPDVRLSSWNVPRIGSLNVRLFKDADDMQNLHLVQGKEEETIKTSIPYELNPKVVQERSAYFIAAFNSYFKEYDVRLSLSSEQEINLVVNQAYIDIHGLGYKAKRVSNQPFKTALELMIPNDTLQVLTEMDKLCDRGIVYYPEEYAVDSEVDKYADEAEQGLCTVFRNMTQEQWEEYKHKYYYVVTETEMPPYLYEACMICMLICTYRDLFPIVVLDDTRHIAMVGNKDYTHFIEQEMIDIQACFNKFIHFYQKGLVLYTSEMGYLCSEQSIVVQQVEE